VALLHIVNSAAIPVSPDQSYSAYAGVQDAMVQWWYGHNAVGFFLTAGFLGMMYYYIPKQAERPVYSYRLSIVHFWALIFTYMWAGPHHLHYTALPDWAQSVGMVFSLVLLAPSWGGMINGIMTLSGCLAQIARRPDPEVPHRLPVVLRHVDVRGADDVDQDRQRAEPLHRLDGRPCAQRCAGLGRADLDGCPVLPDPAPLRPQEMYSVRAIELHFWIATIGIVLYIAAMWIAGVMQGLMWRAVNPDGTLVYSFVESVKATFPFYVIRLLAACST
jgi:cytochrome c oxidase cbb3-type subunit 1